MTPRLLARLALLAVVAVVAVIVVSAGGDEPYVAKLEMTNANGLKDGSPVTVGGVRVGKVDVDVDVERGVAVAELRVDPKYAPFGRDARAAIVAQNLLGQKSVRVTPGDPARPAPSGTVIPEDRVTKATDLDRVLNVLDADTRTRLAIFVNEAGTAFTGRRADFNRFLKDITPAVAVGTDLLGELGRDNRRLRDLLTTSDRFVAEMAARKDDVVRMVDRFGQGAAVSAGKRAELRRTLAEAPGALATLRTFLAQLRSTTEPLGPAARKLSAAAAPLRGALAELEPFRKAASPALRTARDVAPTLEQLAAKATPVLRSATPTTAALRETVGEDLPPITDMASRSIDNTLATVENWARAIQYRDNLSHIFRGEASFSPDAIQSIINRIAPRPKAKKKQRAEREAVRAPKVDLPKLPKVGKEPLRLPKVPELVPGLNRALEDVRDGLQGTVDGVLGGLGAKGAPERSSDRQITSLLDFLLK